MSSSFVVVVAVAVADVVAVAVAVAVVVVDVRGERTPLKHARPGALARLRGTEETGWRAQGPAPTPASAAAFPEREGATALGAGGDFSEKKKCNK